MHFDTNVIIVSLSESGDQDIKFIVSDCIEHNNAFISDIVIAEVLAYSGYTDIEIKNIKDFLINNFNIVAIESRQVFKASEIARDKKIKTGKRLKLTDAIIAATAIQYNKALFTLDKEDFNNIPDLQIYNHSKDFL